MKKSVFVIIAVLLLSAVLFSAGCTKNEGPENTSAPQETQEQNVPESVSAEKSAPASFKPGTWASDAGVNYVFYEDGKSGKNINLADSMGIGFTYELNSDGSCIFHMGSVEDNTKATVKFSDGGDTATIAFADGDVIVLKFAGANITED